MAAASITKVFMTTASLTTVSLMTVSSSVPIILSHDPVEVARLGVRVLMLVTMGTMSVTSMLVLSYFVCRTRRRRKAASYKQVSLLLF